MDPTDHTHEETPALTPLAHLFEGGFEKASQSFFEI